MFDDNFVASQDGRHIDMPTYFTIDQVARKLNVPAEMLRHFIASGWLSATEKNGLMYLAGHQEYKAKFILHLKNTRKLSDQQIGKVLAAQQPPYSLKAVDVILKRG